MQMLTKALSKPIPSGRSRLGYLAAVLVLLGACSEQTEQAAVPDQQSFSESFQAQLIQAQPGDIIEVPAGVHEFSRSLSLSVSGVTIRGAGIDTSILSFKNQQQGAEGLLVNADDFTIEDLAIEDTIGDALKINDSNNVVIRRVRVEWTGGPDTDNGAYGFYPVQSSNILIEESIASGASDAGIYVGQSRNIIVRNSRAEFNVAGIEVENSTHADVYGNVATNNTAGILVFDLPNLEVQGGQATRIFGNRMVDNNLANFAPAGNIVARVPPGTGLLVLANDNIEVFDNEFADNGNVHAMAYSYTLSGIPFDDPAYDPYPEGIYIHDNSYVNGGYEPRHPALVALKEESGKNTPNVVWDGIVKNGGSAENLICLGAEEAKSFVNLNALQDAPASYEVTAHRCTSPQLPEITLELPNS